jgi:hypothetical protein
MKHHPILLYLLLCLGFHLAAAATGPDMRKGQRTYLLQCKKCHGVGTKGAAMKQQEEWDLLFADHAARLRQHHRDTKAKGYFESGKFRDAAAPLHRFLHYYGADSGNVPVCN